MSLATLASAAVLFASSFRLAGAVAAQTFEPPSKGPLVQTANYTSFSNNTLHTKNVVKGKVFNRIIQVWLENTDFETAASTPIFESLASQGLLFTNYHSVTHPSEPNYVAALGGDFFGMHDDNMYHIPSNISTIVDLLEDKKISWATYQENMPEDGYYGFTYTATNYGNSSAAPYTYYVRKHNPSIVYDSISQDADRVKNIRTFNDFANDVVNGTLPQWIFVTPNMVNDAHDTTIDFAASFLEYWFLPLLTDPRVNDEDTLILLTFDENETDTIQNTIWSLALGGALPLNLRGTTDDALYTHFSSLSTVQANWGLGSLGRQDTNATVSNVFSFVAEKTGYQNVKVPANEVPLFNLTNVVPGALTSNAFIPFAAPNLKAKGAGHGPVFLRSGLDKKLTVESLPPPVNKTALNSTTPWQMSPTTTSGEHLIPCAGAACP
ncbi:phosphoesterase family-domain-containing protein [Mycena rosella]|uniref:Phosphoesterase family-domain-containing protein n=1 Tax=Mycena rosella TaxID=1033263 RepID=A0AAD7BP49_MYCRO|nr:phosphoesterase family-domain-containing protein [Mycena rosella]